MSAIVVSPPTLAHFLPRDHLTGNKFLLLFITIEKSTGHVQIKNMVFSVYDSLLCIYV